RALGVLVVAVAGWPMLRAAARASATEAALRPALARLDAGDLAGAREGVEAALAHDPKSSRPWLALARGLVRADRVPEAIDAYRRAAASGRARGGSAARLVRRPRLARGGRGREG